MLQTIRELHRKLLRRIPNSRQLAEYRAIYDRFKSFTMIPNDVYVANLQLVASFLETPGDVVECGTWKGGMIAGMRFILGDDRRYVLFDSFEGLPPAKEVDGRAAIAWQANTASPKYYNNCTADEEDAAQAMKVSGATKYEIVKGWFEQTLPAFPFSQGIAVLRLDGDWYDSTMQCLEALFPRVNQGGVIIIDDYYVWDGCSKALHDYLSRNQRTERIRQFLGSVCYLVKS